MYLALIIISIIVLFIINWQIALPISIIVISLDRIMDNYRNEFENKINK